MVCWCGPRGALIAPGMLPAELERKRRQHGASCPGGTVSAAGWRFRVFFGDNRYAAPQPAENRQVQQDGQQAGSNSPGCISCPQTRRNNNHDCRVRKRLPQSSLRLVLCNEEIGDAEVERTVPARFWQREIALGTARSTYSPAGGPSCWSSGPRSGFCLRMAAFMT